MNCNELVELITDYLDGHLSAQDHERFEEHLAECEGCHNYVEQMRGIVHAAGQLEEKAIPPDTKEKLLEVFRDWKKDV